MLFLATSLIPFLCEFFCSDGEWVVMATWNETFHDEVYL